MFSITSSLTQLYVSWPLLVSFSVVEFKDEEFVKKAIEVMSKHDLNGRPLNIKEVEISSSRCVLSIQCVFVQTACDVSACFRIRTAIMRGASCRDRDGCTEGVEGRTAARPGWTSLPPSPTIPTFLLRSSARCRPDVWEPPCSSPTWVSHCFDVSLRFK